jgi:hypothetical protein
MKRKYHPLDEVLRFSAKYTRQAARCEELLQAI